MSMNLKCNQIELWQTPTHISYMCMITDSNGGLFSCTLRGKKAAIALSRYKQWVKTYCEGSYTDSEKDLYESKRSSMLEHIKKIDNVIKCCNRKLEVCLS